MKYNWMMAGVVAAGCLAAGCNKQNENTPAAPPAANEAAPTAKVDLTPLKNSFQSAPAEVKDGLDKVVTAVKSQDYQAALTELKTLATSVKLTPEQKQALAEVMSQIENAIGGAAAQVKDQATKAVGDLQKSLKK